MIKRILSNKQIAFFCGLAATSIYGLNHTIAKEVMPYYIQPAGFILLRVISACILFWIIGFFLPKEKIYRKDIKPLIAASLFGMCINMLAFFIGLDYSTPIHSSVIITMVPIFAMILAFFILKEKLNRLNFLGIIIGFMGALLLILNNKQINIHAPNIPLGNFLFLINSFSYAYYLIIMKPLTKKYSTITLMKYLFLFGVIINFPFTITQFGEIEWQALPWDAIWRICFVVIGTTFLTYFLNAYALRFLSATTLSVFVYLQPIIGILYAVIVGIDKINSIEIFAMILVFLGVFWVNKKSSKQKTRFN